MHKIKAPGNETDERSSEKGKIIGWIDKINWIPSWDRLKAKWWRCEAINCKLMPGIENAFFFVCASSSPIQRMLQRCSFFFFFFTSSSDAFNRLLSFSLNWNDEKNAMDEKYLKWKETEWRDDENVWKESNYGELRWMWKAFIASPTPAICKKKKGMLLYEIVLTRDAVRAIKMM